MNAPVDYMTLPLEKFTIRDLTDAIGIAESARVLDTSTRAIYTQRNTRRISVDRMQKLVAHLRTNERHYRERLAIKRDMQARAAATVQVLAQA